MIKVIAHGYSKFTVNCYNCGCCFEYELEDVCNGEVICPDCGYNVTHNRYCNCVLTSKINDEEDN